jgi:hypothetical protein
LQLLLPEGCSRFIAQTRHLVALPTFGCFTPGYILVIPRVHVTSFGLLDAGALAEADELIAALAARIMRVYGMPALGFETLSVYPVDNRPEQRIRLRRLVAELDPRIDAENWDWAAHNYTDLIQRTAADLGAPSVTGGRP